MPGLSDKVQVSAVALLVGLVVGVAVGYKYFVKKHCAFTNKQIIDELRKLPEEVAAATISIPFEKVNGQWIGKR